jgi:subtilase family serine protease
LGALPIDRGVARERALYKKLHIQERYGITFHAYASLCRDRRRAVANCGAKILTDDSGTPLTFDPAKQDVPGYSPKELRAAYGVTGVANGLPIIGIVDAYADPSALADLKVYSKQFKLPVLPKCEVDVAVSPVPCIQIVNQKGGKKLPKTVDESWATEQSLDLDTAHAMCENCSILLVEADSNGFGDLFPSENTAARLGATVISNSWGSPEFDGEQSADAQFFTHPGVVMTAGTGDDGYAAGVLWPASSPNVVGVGGTTLLLSNNGKKYVSEVAWEGAGSGCSAYEARPSWQPSLPGCPDNRTESDISADADPNTGIAVYASTGCTANSCWEQIGGTSLSAPIVAALYALAGGIAQNDTQGADVLYRNASKRNSRDITSGSTGTCEFAYLCNAVVGYDGPTGLGSPKGLGVFSKE